MISEPCGLIAASQRQSMLASLRKETHSAGAQSGLSHQ